MFDPVKLFEDEAITQDLEFIYGAKPFQNWEITQREIITGRSFLGLFPFRERAKVFNGGISIWSVSTVLWVGRKYEPTGTVSSLDETERQKYDRRLKDLRELMEVVLEDLCASIYVEVTDAEIFRELNKFDENTDVIGCNLTFEYNVNDSNE